MTGLFDDLIGADELEALETFSSNTAPAGSHQAVVADFDSHYVSEKEGQEPRNYWVIEYTPVGYDTVKEFLEKPKKRLADCDDTEVMWVSKKGREYTEKADAQFKLSLFKARLFSLGFTPSQIPHITREDLIDIPVTIKVDHNDAGYARIARGSNSVSVAGASGTTLPKPAASAPQSVTKPQAPVTVATNPFSK